jgi:signal transduction histidine kinase
LEDRREQQRRWWLAALVSGALLSIVATLATAAGFARGVRKITQGLAILEEDYHHRIPEAPGELGEIARAINRMIEKREALERELRREDRLRAMGRLVAAVAHEIRNPLNGMRLSAQLLKKQASQGRVETVYLDSIVAEVDRLEDLVRELLAFGRNQPPELKTLDVRPYVERAARLVAAQAKRQGVAIRIEAPQGPSEARFDESRLMQVLLNLLLNSLESQKDGGWVRLDIIRENGVLIRVTDSGPALLAEDQERLFEMFASNKPGGIGLGLAVSRALMRQMGGELEYDPQSPHASFVVRLLA